MWKKTDDLDSSDSDTRTRSTSSNTKSSSGGISTIGSNSVITGEIKGNEDLLVRGSFDGTIVLDKNSVTVGRKGIIKGKVQAKTVIVEGRVDGDVIAGEKIILKDSGKVKANLVTARLVVDDGCHFQGGIDMNAIESKPKQVASTSASTPASTPAVKPDSANKKVVKKI